MENVADKDLKNVVEQIRTIIKDLPDEEKLAVIREVCCPHCGGDPRYSDGMLCQCWNDE